MIKMNKCIVNNASLCFDGVIVILQSYSELSKVVINYNKRVFRIISDYQTLAPQTTERVALSLESLAILKKK